VILVDTSVLLAAANRDEREHEACAQLVQTHRGALLVSPLVAAEVCYMLASRSGPEREAQFLDDFGRGVVILARLSAGDTDRMAALVRQYADLELGGTDASVIALAERLRLREVATLDHRHFRTVRPAHCDTFELLPE